MYNLGNKGFEYLCFKTDFVSILSAEIYTYMDSVYYKFRPSQNFIQSLISDYD